MNAGARTGPEARGRAWRRPRWGLWAGLLALLGLLHWGGPPALIKLGLGRAAQSGQPGWLLLSAPGGAPAWAPPGRPLPNPAGGTLVAYALWRAPQSGEYAFNLTGSPPPHLVGLSLGLDGQPVASLEEDRRGQVRLELGAGPHLLRLEVADRGKGQGWGQVQVYAPGEPSADLLAQDGPRSPPAAGIEAWWRLLWWLGDPALAGGLASLATMLLVLLPLCLAGGWRGLAAWVGIILLPALLLAGPPQRTPFLGGPLIKKLQDERPAYVVIGNSLAEGSVHRGLLARLAGGNVFKLTYSGSETTIHYLLFKHVLLASGTRPRVTFIFTQDNSLTNPHLMVFPKAFATLSPQGRDPLVERLVFGGMSPSRALDQALGRVFRVRAYQDQWSQAVPGLALELAQAGAVALGQPGDVKLRKHANSRFGLERLRQRPEGNGGQRPDRWETPYDPEQYLDFDQVLGASFLPHFITLARERGLKLVFVRMPHRPGPEGPSPQDPRLERYVGRLADYLRAQGMGFHDFTGDPGLPQAMFLEDDHIADAEGFTRLFYERLREVFP